MGSIANRLSLHLTTAAHRLRGLSGAFHDLRSMRSAIWICTGVVLATLLAMVLVVLMQTEKTALGKARAEVERSVRVAQTIVNRQLLQVDGALASLPVMLARLDAASNRGTSAETAAQLIFGMNHQTAAFRDLLLLTTKGEIWASARPGQHRRHLGFDISAIPAGDAAGARVIGPSRSAVTGEWNIYIARRIELAGVGATIAVAEIPVATLMMALTEIANVPGSRLLVARTNNVVIGSIPADDLRIGQVRQERPISSTRHPRATLTSLTGGPDVIEASRGTLYDDVAVIMQMSRQAALADWARDRDWLAFAFLLAAALVLSLALMLQNGLMRKARLEEAREQSLAMLQDAIEAMSDGFVMWDEQDRLVTCNSVYRDLYAESAAFIKPGVTFEEVVRKGAQIGQYPQAGKDIEKFVANVVAWHKSSQGSIERLLPDGRWLLVSERRTAGGGTVGIRTNVTELKKVQSELGEAHARVRETMQTLQEQNDALRDRDLTLRSQNMLFDAALNNMSHGLLMADAHQRVIVSNHRFNDLLGIGRELPLNGRTLQDALACAADQGQAAAIVAQLCERQDRLGAGREVVTSIVRMRHGKAVAITQRPMHDGGFVAIFEDVTEQDRAEGRIRFLAHHDSLTGLPNRVQFRAELEKRLTALPAGQRLALFYLDLDRFKDVNDALGHLTGDTLLTAVGDRLRQCLRASDLMARLGGDEFAIAFNGSVGEVEARVASLAQGIIYKLSQPYIIDGDTLSVGVSMGVAVAADDVVDVETLFKRADLALYAAKDEGRGRYLSFVPQMEAKLHSRLQLEHDLKAALVRDEFRVVYQPLCDLETGRIIGHEALLRWDCATRGPVPPSTFIPMAENLNMIGGLGAWCLERACRDMAAWQGDAKIAVNLSPLQLRGDEIVDVVMGALNSSGLDPGRLELEITESALLEGSDESMARLHRLHALGVRIVLDDFGTGFSSLNYLRSFPFDKIKIDKVFVTEAATRPDCQAIVESLAMLAAKLGMTTTAEGIETAEQLDLVKRLGCTEGQGYLLGRPQSILSALTALERQNAPTPKADVPVSAIAV